MKIVINNADIVLESAPQEFIAKLTKKLSYKDKGLEYQIRRMESNPFQKNSPYLKKLKKDLYGTVVKQIDMDIYTVPSGFHQIFINSPYTIDNRKETGETIALPWINKPFNPRPYQEEALEMMKCHAKGESVLMYDGSTKNVENIVIGDLLMGPDSKPRKVLQTHSGHGDMYKIKPKKGKPFTVNGHHKLSLRRSYDSKSGKNAKIPNDEILNISVKDYLASSSGLKHKYKLYRPGVIEFAKSTPIEIDMYMLGLWLGDGCSRTTSIATNDAEVENYIYSFAEKENMNVSKSDSDKFLLRLSSRQPKARSNAFRNFLFDNNLYRNKHIPLFILRSSVKERLDLLAGLLDADGSYYAGIFDITQKNKTLAENIVFLCRSLGLAAYIKESYKVATNSENPTKSLYYRITIAGDIDTIPTKIKRKQAETRKQIKNVNNIGFSVERVDNDEFYGFEVDQDHLYLMSDFIVTHNCNWRGTINFATGLGKTLTAVHAIRKFKKKALVVCPGVSIADNFYEELVSAFGEHRVGYFGGGKKKIKDITVAIAASVNNHVDKFKEADLGLVIFDEVHHLAASTFFSISEGLADIGRMYGLTATNFRNDGKEMLIEAGVGPNIIKRDLIWGINNKWLANPYIIVRDIPTIGREFKNDKNKNYKAHILNQDEMTNRIISDARKFMSASKSVLILVKEVEHGKIISEKLGLPFATGTDRKSSEYVKQLNEGKIPGLVGTDSRIGEGTDTKNVDCLILANFVASKGPLWQNLGRGLRIHNGQDKVVVLDYVPLGSKMLTRHAKQRIKYYKEITKNIRTC